MYILKYDIWYYTTADNALDNRDSKSFEKTNDRFHFFSTISITINVESEHRISRAKYRHNCVYTFYGAHFERVIRESRR